MTLRPAHILLSLTLLLASCSLSIGSNEEAQGEEMEIVRFDRAQEAYLAAPSFPAWQTLVTVYPRETRILVEDELKLGSLDDESISDSLALFFADSTLVTLCADVDSAYADVTTLSKDLAKVFEALRSEYPEAGTPRVYTQISALNQSIVVGDSIIGISLDKYLGADYPLYQRYYNAGQRLSMTKGHIVPDVLNFYLNYLFPPTKKERTLSRVMIHMGKFHWAVSRLMQLSLLSEVTPDHHTHKSYAAAEAATWRELSRPEVLHTTDSATIVSYMAFQPDTPHGAKSVPERIGVWIGMRIVDAYMRKHKDVTLTDLLRDDDAEKIIRESGYSPV